MISWNAEQNSFDIENGKGKELIQILNKHQISPIASICGGTGQCGKCKVIVIGESSATNNPTKIEKRHLSPQELLDGIRLACQVKIEGKVRVYIPNPNILVKEIQSQTISDLKFLPSVKKYYFEINPVQNDEQLFEDFLNNLQKNVILSSKTLKELKKNSSRVIRDAKGKITVTIFAKKTPIDIETGNTSQSCFGFALDIGTTKLALEIIDLTNGNSLSMYSMANPQISLGEDIITRLQYAKKGQIQKEELQKKLIIALNDMINKCCHKLGINPRNVYEVTVVGNTVMHHLLIGLPIDRLSIFPYEPTIKKALNIQAHEFQLAINSKANIHFMPNIEAFLGSDCIGSIISTGLYRSKQPSLLIDIGTNTEIVACNQGKLSACSCASGPAFEGGHIKYGMKATPGAIKTVKIDPSTLKASIQTIDDLYPLGLCGSGIVDLIAEMLKVGILNRNGTIQSGDNSPRIRLNQQNTREYIIKDGAKGSSEILITQKDIREIQLAKAAIRTGILILLSEMNIKPQDIKRCYFAGAFGTYLNPENAKSIGMIPNFLPTIMKSVGNAACGGAKMALVSTNVRKTSGRIAGKVKYIELSRQPNFQSLFIESLKFSE
jgi:uncharacterized 2Fe-2S/4Fe-4S cluster protein (DUF4445 family)